MGEESTVAKLIDVIKNNHKDQSDKLDGLVEVAADLKANSHPTPCLALQEHIKAQDKAEEKKGDRIFAAIMDVVKLGGALYVGYLTAKGF